MLRLFVDAELREGGSALLDGGQAAWLGRVMRRRAGDRLALFNGRDGEWEAHLAMACALGLPAVKKMIARDLQ